MTTDHTHHDTKAETAAKEEAAHKERLAREQKHLEEKHLVHPNAPGGMSYTQAELARRSGESRKMGGPFDGDPFVVKAITAEEECQERRDLMVKLANDTLGDPLSSDLDRQIATLIVRQTPIPGDRKLPPPGYTDQGGGPLFFVASPSEPAPEAAKAHQPAHPVVQHTHK